MQRLKHIELLWTGSQELAYAKNDRKKYISKRTEPLTWLNECSRLRSLKVFVQESDQYYMRRKHETRGVIEYMKRKTMHQPDYRLNRSLRMIQGMDHVYSLRGMEEAVFFDYDIHLKNLRHRLGQNRSRTPVRDCDFVLDINRHVRQCKHSSKRQLSRLEGLTPMVDGYGPSDDEWPVLREQFEVDWDTPFQPSRTINGPALPPGDDIAMNQSSGGNDHDGGLPGSGAAIRVNDGESRQSSPASSEDGSSSSSSGSDNGDDGDSAAGSNQAESSRNATRATSNFASSPVSDDPHGIVQPECPTDLMAPNSRQSHAGKQPNGKAKTSRTTQDGSGTVQSGSQSQPIEFDNSDAASPVGNEFEIHEATPGTEASLFIDAVQNGIMQPDATEFSSVGTVAWRESTADTDIYDAPTTIAAGEGANTAPSRASSSEESESLFITSPEPDGYRRQERAMDNLNQLGNHQPLTAWQGDTRSVWRHSSADIELKSEVDSKDDVMQGLKQESPPVGSRSWPFGINSRMEGSSAETAINLDSESDEESEHSSSNRQDVDRSMAFNDTATEVGRHQANEPSEGGDVEMGETGDDTDVDMET